jgi:hypothetical protein
LFEIRPWEGDGLSFVDAIMGETKNVKLDGKDYPLTNPKATAQVSRVGKSTLEMTDKMNGNLIDARRVGVNRCKPIGAKARSVSFLLFRVIYDC